MRTTSYFINFCSVGEIKTKYINIFREEKYMQDTQPFVPREIIITCGLFLTILIIGTFVFDMYNKQETSILITGAATAVVPEEDNTSNKITGNVIGISGAATFGEDSTLQEYPQIGIYSITPSFSITDNYNLVEEYGEIQKGIRNFGEEVNECHTTDALDICIQKNLEKQEYGSWLDEKECETKEEALFYDFTEIFSDCLISQDTNCLCYKKLDSGRYEEGRYIISVIQEDSDVTFFLKGTDISATFSPMYFEINDAKLVSDDYTLEVDDEVKGGFSSIAPSSDIYLYKKDATTISVEDQSSFSTYSTTRGWCKPQEKRYYKFCIQSDTQIPVYDKESGKSIQQAVVYMFALDFDE